MKQPFIAARLAILLWAALPVAEAKSNQEQLWDLKSSYSFVRHQEKSLLHGLGPREKAIVDRVKEYGSDRKLVTFDVVPMQEDPDLITFAVVPKQLIEFFEPTRLGCLDQAHRLTQEQEKHVECLYIGPVDAENRGEVQAEIVEEMLWGRNAVKIHGLAISVVDPDLMTPIMDRAVNELKIPVVTFDSDAPESARSYYIGTNNTFFGRQLARQMLSLNPQGGTFGIISGESTNLQDRADGILKELANQQSGLPSGSEHVWKQLPDSPFDALNNMTLALDKMNEWASQNPTVLLSVTGLPMRVEEIVDEETGEVEAYAPWQDFVDSNRHRNITLLCADASLHQLKFLEYDYIDGLAGQLPYDMGIKSINILWTLLHNPNATLGDSPDSDFVGTNVIWHVAVPLNLPPITVDMNRVGNLQYVGYTLFGVTAATALGFAVWMFVHRAVRVVRVAQPTFLLMIALGVVVMEASMIPLGMDDLDSGGVCDPDEEDIGFGHHCQVICMGVPWLWSIGFTLVFSALFSKTWRINQVFRTANSQYSRAKVSEREMLIPFSVLMSINLAILIAWTVVDPLQYRREADIARDEWNRVIATYGVCKSDHASSFLFPLLVINAFVLILANWQAYEARHIQAEFAESKYIAICMFSMLQAMVSGVPVLFFVRDLPRAYYMVFVLLCFIIGMVILLVMFVPKVIFTHQFMQMSPELQKQYLADAVGKSTKRPPGKKSFVNGQSSGPSTVRVSTMSDGGQGMVVRKNIAASMFPLPEQYPEEPDEPNTNPISISGQSDENGLNDQDGNKFQRPVDVLKNRQTGGWAGMTLTEVLSNEPIEEESEESHGDIEGDIEGGDKALPLPFERPVDVLKNNRETTGWGGITTSEIAATSEVLGNNNEGASESEDADAEGFDDDQAPPMKPFERPVDVLKDNRETTGWGGATLSEVIN